MKFKKFNIKRFGCQMNVYDSNKIGDILLNLGLKKTLLIEDSDIDIINTCHIRDKAKQKLYSELGKLYKLKKNRLKKNKKTLIVVTGCVAQAEGKEIFKRAPFVNIVLGSQSYQKLSYLIEKEFHNLWS